MHSWTLTVMSRDRSAADRRQRHQAKHVTELVSGVAHILQGSFRCSLVEILYPWERANHCLFSHLLTCLPLHQSSFKKLQIVEKRLNYMQITVCSDISLFQIDDNSGGMYFSTTQSRLCHSTKHLLSSLWQTGETELMQPPSCLS